MCAYSNIIKQILNHTFGYLDFRGQQREIIQTTLDGNDSLVLMPTGGGKSLCYQIPGIVREGMAIVVSPLIALMQDQVAALKQLGLRAAYLNSTLSREEYNHVMRLIYDGELDLLYIAPERLLQENTLQRLISFQISLIAIDEAHCVSQWGHDFRADYLGLHVLKQAFPNVPRIALTATADERTREEIITRLALHQPKRFVSSFDRPNIRYIVQEKGDAKAQLIKFLQDYKNKAGVVYCMSRNRVDGIAAWLQARGVKALPYHAGLSAQERAENQHRFLREEGVVMVATIAFGMGIDKPDVRFVAHLDLPKSMEAYYQETGRAGRDGQPSDAWMVYGLQDVMRIVKMVQDSNADEQHKRIERGKIESLLGWCEATTCRRRALLRYFGEETDDVCGTYGIGADMSDKQWRSIIRQLIVQRYLLVNDAQYGAIQLTEKARGLLKGDIKLFLREDAVSAKPVREKKLNARVDEADRDLWEALKACRKTLADDQGIPPYAIFHDATLMEMMQFRPSNNAEFLTINGVGAVKLEKYGDEFLAVLFQFSN